MKIFPILALFLSAGPVLAQDVDCDSAMTQMEMTLCAGIAAERADNRLNRIWAELKPLADARGEGAGLLKAQRAWIAYRDAACAAERDKYKGGSIAPMVYADCITKLTRRRNADLRAMR